MPKRRLVIKGQEPPAPAPKKADTVNAKLAAKLEDIRTRVNSPPPNDGAFVGPAAGDSPVGTLRVDPDSGRRYITTENGEVEFTSLAETTEAQEPRIAGIIRDRASASFLRTPLPAASENGVYLAFHVQDANYESNLEQLDVLGGQRRTVQLRAPELTVNWSFSLTGGPLPREFVDRMQSGELASIILHYLLTGRND